MDFSRENGTVEKGVLILDKPQGITSFDVVYKLRRITGQRKIGIREPLIPWPQGYCPCFWGKLPGGIPSAGDLEGI